MQSLRGGEKSVQDLQNLTNHNDSIISVPLEGKDELIKEDFLSLGINYAILPDLHVGDGEIQVMVANGDVPKVQHWYKLYSEECRKSGEELGSLQLITSEEYTHTGAISEEQYIQLAEGKYKEADEKYHREPGEIEKLFLEGESDIRLATDKSFLEYYNNPEYIPLSINHESLVEKSSYAGGEEVKGQGFFASRIPGTWGENEQTLIIPTEQVFVTDEGQTYLAYIHKEQKPIVMDAVGKAVSVTKRPTGEELFTKHYDLVKRSIESKEISEIVQDIGERIPANPLKSR
ncbi:hypothetical protein NK118_14360 [Lachnospiraceae bacterium PAL227]|uniref:Uncharacterized protein n=2 Tax=Ohessyouella blattaphilus TaxID=2949333 RepID=A0ABT1EL76_9FIRM|nr:hypothetical protein [Ohessyouella blattaphilus]MCP1111433.1 hypothetical protein [Ohessyouella blattaphilus]MCR8564827.1 hypothetical protein [Ohessyouella blattaphilus]